MAQSHAVRRVSNEHLGHVAAVLAVLVAGVHFFYPQRGVGRFLLVLSTGDLSLFVYDPRPLVFVVSAVAILLGTVAVWMDVWKRPVYLLGMVLMASYFVGYFAWHLSGHGGFLPVRQPHYHGGGPIVAVVSHLRAYPTVALSKVAEAVLFVLLGILYRRAP